MSEAENGAAVEPLPGVPIRGEIRVPGSKSLAQRYLLMASLARGATAVAGLPPGADVERALELVRAVGAEVTPAGGPGAVRVRGRAPASPTGGWLPPKVLDAGESATLARFAVALCALCSVPGRRTQIDGRGTLLARASPALFAGLEAAGVRLGTPRGPGRFPVELCSVGPPSELFLKDPSSSQEVSALATALAAYPGPGEVRIEGTVPSAPYLEMTLWALERFQVTCQWDREQGSVRVGGPLAAPKTPLVVEPDASSAAVALVAACATGGELLVRGLGAQSPQGDVRVAEHLRAFGCEAGFAPGGLWARGAPTRPAELDLRGEPDLAPPLAALAAAWALGAPSDRATSRIGGLGALDGKESPRLEQLYRGLLALGFRAERGPDWLRIGPPSGHPPAVELDGASDHRMVFAWSVLGWVRGGVRIRGPGAVEKSWPNFYRDLGRLGARLRP